MEKLHLFLVSGKTLTFFDAEFLQDNETVLVFRYRAQSDNLLKEATFFKGVLAGWSRTTKKS